MNYHVIETSYGPEIRANDWRVTEGAFPEYPFQHGLARRTWAEQGPEKAEGLYWGGGFVQLFAGTDPARITRADQPAGGGGDVALRIEFVLERLGEEGSIRFLFNAGPPARPGPAAFTVEIRPGGVEVFHLDQRVAEGELQLTPGSVATLSFATLGQEYQIRLNDELLVGGRMPEGSGQNEGFLHVEAHQAGITLREFQEDHIAEPVEFKEWRRTELLYEETFSEESLEKNWVVTGFPVQVVDGAFVFCQMSVGVLRERFEGPLVVEFTARALRTDTVSAGVTDAISIWMMDKPEGDLMAYLESLPDPARRHYLDLPFYWMDQGGSNNMTTRLRRNPNLWLIRQFIDRDRLLEPDRVYEIGLVQHGHAVEYWVDGEPWIQAWDAEPHTEGHVGFRGFSGPSPDGTPILEIRKLKVWRIE